MRVRASWLNYRDLTVLKGGGRGLTKLGVVPLSDGAGEVAAIGEGGFVAQCSAFYLSERSTGSTALPWRYRRLVKFSNQRLSLQRSALVRQHDSRRFRV